MTASVLCAIDINRPDDEKRVLETAARLADLDGARLDVITVVPDFGASLVGVYFQDHQVETARDKAGEILKATVEASLGSERNKSVRHIVAIGRVYEEVLKAAGLADSDLIVIGAHRPDFKDYLLGPNAARVVRHSTCSVYVVR